MSDLYGDFRSGPKAVLNLELFVYTENNSTPVVVFKKTYKRSVDIQTKEAGDLVSGWNQAFAEIKTEIGIDLKDRIVIK